MTMGQQGRPHAQPEIDRATAHQRVAQRLASVDQRYTSGRRLLVDQLLELGRPVTLPELAEAEPSLPTSSMYRNLEVLERHGLVRRITTMSDHSRYELSEPLVSHHHHLICVSCGRVDDIELDAALEHLVEKALARAASDAGFTPQHHTLDLHGHCADCTPTPT